MTFKRTFKKVKDYQQKFVKFHFSYLKVSKIATLACFADFEDKLIINITLDNCPRLKEFLATAVVKQHKQLAQWGSDLKNKTNAILPQCCLLGKILMVGSS